MQMRLPGPVRVVVAFWLLPMPQVVKRAIGRRLLGWVVHPSARIGLSLVDCDRLELGPGSAIGHLNVIRGMAGVRLGANSSIGNWNWFTCAGMFRTVRGSQSSSVGRLEIGPHSAITSRHYVDCSGGVYIGQFTTIGGVRSTILSHQIDLALGVQSAATTTVGDYCFVSSNACLTPGSSVPDRSIVAMGAVVVGALPHPGSLYGGVPAQLIRSGIDSGRYFSRPRGFVGLGAVESAGPPTVNSSSSDRAL